MYRPVLFALIAALVVGVPACYHSEPFGTGDPAALPPLDDRMPRRLTFNPGDDRTPSGSLGRVLYSRLDPSRATPGRCLTFIPDSGGTIEVSYCPPAPSAADTFVSTWLEPVTNAAGDSIAYLWLRSAATSSLAAWTHHLVTAPVDAPADTTRALLLAGTMPGGRFFNTAMKITWIDQFTIRFLAAYDSIFKVKGGGSGRFTDTVVVPRGVVNLDLDSRALLIHDGMDSAVAYAPAPDGGTWLVRGDDPTAILRARPSEPGLDTVATVAGAVTDIAVVGDRVVVAIPSLARFEWIDPAMGQRGAIPGPGPARRIGAVGTRRFVAEVERAVDLFGGPANLWLFELPRGRSIGD